MTLNTDLLYIIQPSWPYSTGWRSKVPSWPYLTRPAARLWLLDHDHELRAIKRLKMPHSLLKLEMDVFIHPAKSRHPDPLFVSVASASNSHRSKFIVAWLS